MGIGDWGLGIEGKKARGAREGGTPILGIFDISALRNGIFVLGNGIFVMGNGFFCALNDARLGLARTGSRHVSRYLTMG